MTEQKKRAGGFVQIPWAAFLGATSPEIHVLGIVTHYCSMKRGGFPSVKTIAQNAGKKRRAVFRILASLEKKGLIKRIQRKGETSLYCIPETDTNGDTVTPEETPETSAKKYTGGCRKMQDTHAEKFTQNNIDVNNNDRGGLRTRTRTRNDIFPHSVDEVMKLAQEPFSGAEVLPCTWEQAAAYFTDRKAKNWTPNGQLYRMKTKLQIQADIRRWLMQDLKTEREKHTNRNKFSRDYDSADDGSNF